MCPKDFLCPVGEAVTRWTRRKDARPSEILEAALELFTEKGFAATRMDDIAKRAGVTAGTLYRYFPNKEDMFKALISDALAPTLNQGIALFEDIRDPASVLLKQMMMLWWEQAGKTGLSAITKLIVTEGGNFPDVIDLHTKTVIQPGEALIGKALELGMSQGEFRQLDIPITVKVIIAPILMGMLWKHSPTACCGFDQLDLNHYIETAIDTVIAGLRNVNEEPQS